MNDADAWAMVETMARMQDDHNQQVHPQWRNQGYRYYRAVWVECAELLDHFGWKWWKHQQPDLNQVRLEVVDIWHFGLSDLLREGSLDRSVANALGSVLDCRKADSEALREAVERLAEITLVERRFALSPFVAVLDALPLPLPELFRLYVGKNVLNSFRQANGYKDGSYRKTWHGREDNLHLVELLAQIDASPEQVPDLLYAALGDRYPG